MLLTGLLATVFSLRFLVLYAQNYQPRGGTTLVWVLFYKSAIKKMLPQIRLKGIRQGNSQRHFLNGSFTPQIISTYVKWT